MADKRDWPPVDKYLIRGLQEWIGDDVPEFKDGMTPEQCLVAMAERRGMKRVITKMIAIANSQRESVMSKVQKGR